MKITKAVAYVHIVVSELFPKLDLPKGMRVKMAPIGHQYCINVLLLGDEGNYFQSMTKATKYLFEQFENKYSKDYPPEPLPLAIVRAISDAKTYIDSNEIYPVERNQDNSAIVLKNATMIDGELTDRVCVIDPDSGHLVFWEEAHYDRSYDYGCDAISCPQRWTEVFFRMGETECEISQASQNTTWVERGENISPYCLALVHQKEWMSLAQPDGGPR